MLGTERKPLLDTELLWYFLLSYKMVVQCSKVTVGMNQCHSQSTLEAGICGWNRISIENMWRLSISLSAFILTLPKCHVVIISVHKHSDSLILCLTIQQCTR